MTAHGREIGPNMEVRKFFGENLQDALLKVKEQLGGDAYIVATRYVTKGGLFGFGAASWVEIEAAPQEKMKKKSSTQRTSLNHIEEEVLKLREEVANFIRGEKDPKEMADPLFRALIQRGLASDLARQLIDESHRKINSQAELSERALVVRDLLAQRIPIAPPIGKRDKKPYVCALIGPTGVGKTTTIAKLAARYKLEYELNVGLFTLDTYRIAAVDQLRTYSEIINIPLQVVHKPGEAKKAHQRFSDCDLILVDSAGRSQKDTPRMEELLGFLDVLSPDEIHLVLSATTSEKGVANIIDHFRPCGINRVILTKLDEAMVFGHLISILLEEGIPISYLAHGQEVPDDLIEARGENVAALIAGTGV